MPVASIRQLTVLVVEDNDIDFESISGVLERQGFGRAFHRALEGEECLELLRGEGAAAGASPLRPHLIILDLNTPGLDGREVLAEIRQDPLLRKIPVVILTSSDNPGDIEACYRTGANGYHLKAVELPKFERTVEEIIHYWFNAAVLPRN